mmetsp:Transcript_19955/g.24653  ORF Transcript_19955/g.24653 Transcript_19955/m.24653 type:complete len:110 (+) Transcript_19955:537-866(+)
MDNKLVDESEQEEGDEEYEPQFDEDDDDDEANDEEKRFHERQQQQQHNLTASGKAKAALDPVNEAVKEMKSVAEEDSEEDEGNNAGMALKLKEIKSRAGAKEGQHEQNE